MARPRKTDTERIEDLFYDMSLAEQSGLLETLQTLHRLKGRQYERDAQDPHRRAVAMTRALGGFCAGKPTSLLDGIDTATPSAATILGEPE